LERALLEVELTIEQFCDFFGSAWFPNLVQSSQSVLAETTSRIRDFLHRWFHRPEEQASQILLFPVELPLRR